MCERAYVLTPPCMLRAAGRGSEIREFINSENRFKLWTLLFHFTHLSFGIRANNNCQTMSLLIAKHPSSVLTDNLRTLSL